jgi:predicted cupin superfamily sugar epimerase
MHPRAAELIAKLELRRHRDGGYFREIFRSPGMVTPDDDRGPRTALTTIYFLLADDDRSRWHQVRSDEAWHLYEGGPLELFELSLVERRWTRHLLTSVDGERGAPAHVIAAGHWQAARPAGGYALVGCTVGPGFEYADFRFLADDAAAAAELRQTWPELASLL